MIFKSDSKRGRCESWKLNDKEIVNYYNYLGVEFTPQLSLAWHFSEKLAKAKQAINFTWSKL